MKILKFHKQKKNIFKIKIIIKIIIILNNIIYVKIIYIYIYFGYSTL